MKSLLFSSTALVAFVAGNVAEAADLAVRMPVKAPIAAVLPFNWTGFYVGAVAGYSWRDPTIDFAGNGPAQALLAAGVVPRTVTVDPHGFLGGAQAGYNFQTGNTVFGFETDFSYANIRDNGMAGPGSPLTAIFFCGKGCTQIDSFRFSSFGGQSLDWFGTLRGRAGITPFDRLLLFATGGLAYGHANLTASVLNTSGAQTTIPPGTTVSLPACTLICATGSASQWLLGWTAGFGAEYAFSNYWTTKVEYLYYDLGNLSTSFSDPRFPAFDFTSTAAYRGNIVRVALNYKLN